MIEFEPPEVVLTRPDSMFDEPYIEEEICFFTTNRNVWEEEIKNTKYIEPWTIPEKYISRVNAFMTAPTAKNGKDVYYALTKTFTEEDLEYFDWNSCVLYYAFKGRSDIRIRYGVLRNES